MTCKPSARPELELKKNIEQTAFFFQSNRQIEGKAENRIFLEEKLEEARFNFLVNSTDLNTLIRYGRRLADLHFFKVAKGVFSLGI